MKAFTLTIRFSPATVAEGWQFVVNLNGSDRMVWNGAPLPLASHEQAAPPEE